MHAMLARPREDLIEPVSSMLANYVHPTQNAPQRVRDGLRSVMRSITDDDWTSYVEYLVQLGADWGRQDAHPVGRAMTAALLEPLLTPESRLDGVEHLESAAGTPNRRVLVVGNHLSYVDPTAAWALLHRQGKPELADRCTAVAGPKVYEGEPMRLMGASANHTIKVAQSSQLTTNAAGLGPRDLVRITRQSMKVAGDLMDMGRILVIYPEGTRSRTGELGPFLKAVGRWLTMDGALLVPFGLRGTDSIYTLEDDRLRTTRISGRFGQALDPHKMMQQGASRDDVVDATRQAVAELLA
jgi:1-acyl-sn-glycerol-3-phosphate acyltransferase